MPYDAETKYVGPGLFCGAAFAIPLRPGESATLLKSSAIDAVLNIRLEDGEFPCTRRNT